MAGAAALLEDDAAQFGAVIVEEFGRPHIAGHHDGVLRKIAARGRRDLAGQYAQQPVGQIVEIMHAFAQIRIGRAHHARTVVALHALDRGLGGETRLHRFAQAVHPAAVMREHPEGLKHLRIFAAACIGTVDQFIDMGAQLLDRAIEPELLLGDILGDEILDHHARLMQHDVAQRYAIGERFAFHMMAAHMGDIGGDVTRHIGEATRCDDLGQDHRRRLQRLFLFIAVMAPRAVLHDEHTDDDAVAQDRHAEEGMVGFFAGLRQVFEGRMGLRVGEIEELSLCRDGADEAFADLQFRQVDGFALQTFGGIEFQHLAGTHHIDGAYFRDHVGRDQHDDLVEPFLCCLRLRHDLAEPSEKNTRA